MILGAGVGVISALSALPCGVVAGRDSIAQRANAWAIKGSVMTPVELDDCLHGLKRLIGFYNKGLDREQEGLWKWYIQKQDPELFRQALAVYLETGKFCPKPSDLGDIIDTLKEQRQQRQQRRQAAPEKPWVKPPKDVVEGWTYWIPRFFEGSDMVPFRKRADKEPGEALRLLQVVNNEAKALDQPDSIPQEWRLQSIWGEGLTDQQAMATVKSQAASASVENNETPINQ